MKKGIYFSFDAIVASTIFILAMISLMSYWYSVREVLSANDFSGAEEAMRITDLMFNVREDGGFGFGTSVNEKALNYSKLIQ
ncbi:hypothetical protein JXB01_04595, partial [Candidatus Micrarchaeota archaeon]|nr:hypothetical protein [Candidatus Micrarchaeota archaeon]